MLSPLITQETVSFQPVSRHFTKDDPFNTYPLLHETVAISSKVVPDNVVAIPLSGAGLPQSEIFTRFHFYPLYLNSFKHRLPLRK